MKSSTVRIDTIRQGATYTGTMDTELTAPGYYLSRGDTARRWIIRRESDDKPVALLVCN